MEDEHLNCKSKKKQSKKGYPSENLLEELSDSSKVKTKGVSSNENLLEELEDGDIHLPLMGTHFLEWSFILIEETREVNLGIETKLKITYVAKSLTEEDYSVIFNLLQGGITNFAWAYSNMLRLDLALVVYHLNICPNVNPTKKNLHKMHPQVALLVKVELEKLLAIGFTRPIDYSDCISNIIPIAKPIGGIHICTDFKDLNKAYPKDEFFLPNIDMLVNLTTRHAMLSLMDDFSRYNQIKISPKDQHKKTFTTPWGTFCYNVMPFGLKNVGVAYQCAMTVNF